ncbi:predicted protein [Chaetomium globosum CBS 148.51]|uniref:Uncharacterized protein n=1 Tax=Chaetomium globosum (strain ATCC 6205 / CBS 148.51 / DSM 1962 / NBRC 6347 / NRRL 1970) TaxID=306901 RepID=Q2GN30_CHAGB|nr:uncharacterized protein CHGG_10624 [Chaetomium globosum CBS 148.51]EAQ84220.1 predicted protein [Chaetomium globosum CBS 148.51]
MQLTSFFALAFAALAAASAIPAELQERQCVGNLGGCNKRASAAVGRQCCGGLFCCGVVGSNNVCQTANTCGEPA